MQWMISPTAWNTFMRLVLISVRLVAPTSLDLPWSVVDRDRERERGERERERESESESESAVQF